ncbi:H4MPT-linked C1 transfer pathway protein [Candidatus Bathyarchaeota archaeon]|nr:MAG: H4MPT-linked C1 transfer pathway protein [Candidatus Bathyarchaeota archaeon]
MNVLGWDIGGVNTKAAFIKTQKGTVGELKTAIEYFPVWKRGKEKLPAVLEKLKKQLASSTKLDGVGVTMTAELSDAYQTKRNGVNHILTCVEQAFTNTPIYVLDVESNLKSIEEARREPLKVAAANWSATGWMVSQSIKDCFIIDIGSTTTSIIPVIDGKVVAAGKTDLEKLLNGELVYTGALRTNVAAIVDSIPVRGGTARVSSELFALSGDVHLILGNINEEDYTVETADGRGTTKLEAMARLARVVCADIEMLNEEEIVKMANYIYEAQIKQIADGLRQVHNRIKPRMKDKVPVVVTGLGRDFLARKAAQKAGFKEIINLAELLGDEAAVVSTSVGVALMVASKLEGKVIRW